MRIHGRWNFASDAAVDRRQVLAADVMEGNDQVVVVWDGKTGQETSVAGWMCRFTPDGKAFFTVRILLLRTYRLYDTSTGQQLRSFTFNDPLDGCMMLPDSRHALLATRGGNYNLCDLESSKILQSFQEREGGDGFGPYTDDGRFLLVKPAGEKNYIAWDVQKNQRSIHLPTS